MTKESLFRPKVHRDKISLPPTFHIEADGRRKKASVLISGVIGVKSFSENEVLIATKLDGITVKGSFLKIAVLEFRRIRVSGIIDGIIFCERKRGDGR